MMPDEVNDLQSRDMHNIINFLVCSCTCDGLVIQTVDQVCPVCVFTMLEIYPGMENPGHQI